MISLKTCPFCGNKVSIAPWFKDLAYEIKCPTKKCAANSLLMQGTEQELADAWNRREASDE